MFVVFAGARKGSGEGKSDQDQEAVHLIVILLTDIQ